MQTNRFPSCLLLTWRFKAVSYPKTLLHSLHRNSLMPCAAFLWATRSFLWQYFLSQSIHVYCFSSICRSTCDLNSVFDWKPCWHWPHVYLVVSWSLAWWSVNPGIDLYRFPHFSHTWRSVITTLFGVLCGMFSTGREPSMAATSGREPKIKKQYRNYIS